MRVPETHIIFKIMSYCRDTRSRYWLQNAILSELEIFIKHSIYYSIV